MYDKRDPKQVEAVVETGNAILQSAIDLGGTISGEHGIGYEKPRGNDARPIRKAISRRCRESATSSTRNERSTRKKSSHRGARCPEVKPN